MKALPAPPADPQLPTETWVVFSTGQTVPLVLREVARVTAGSEAAAIVSAVETGKDVAGGRRLAIPLSQAQGRKRTVAFLATLKD